MDNGKEIAAEARITFNPAQCGGRPCIRGMRIRVSDILEMLADGVTPETILADFPDLEPEDISAALRLAAKRIAKPCYRQHSARDVIKGVFHDMLLL